MMGYLLQRGYFKVKRPRNVSLAEEGIDMEKEPHKVKWGMY